MSLDESALPQLNVSTASPVLVVIGAGPKAAALAAKARVLRELGLGEVRIIVVERTNKVAANWRGGFGFTDGQNELCTPPEKDIGFPYNSRYGSKVDMEMLRYSWQASLIETTTYSDWVDRGRRLPRLEKWANYVQWALANGEPEEIVNETVVESVEPSGTKLIVHARRREIKRDFEADGVVLTGPGDPIRIKDSPDADGLIFNGKNYWTYVDIFEKMQRGKVAVIGGGGTAASIVLSLLQRAKAVDIQIINPRSSMFIRGESVREKRLLCNSAEWLKLDEYRRLEFIKRTDRGVFPVAAQRLFDEAEKLEIISGEVLALEHVGDKIIVRFKYGDPPRDMEYEYDRVIVALGFDPFSSLSMITEPFRPKAETDAERLEIQRNVDEYLRLPFESVKGLVGPPPNVHVPMLAGLAQGPGFPNLTCLGQLSDRILSLYVPPPEPSRRRRIKAK
ncbi:MAG: mycobactin lysine-N-oxygenase [Acidobacteriota bacterium]|jgi:mycobactin lysine-N-oxygenase|nr:mycobactin lysine-N-oxygenase [Acidobacteriota bacterium]